MNLVNCQSYSWCFTLNNYTETDTAALLALDGNTDIAHIIFGREVGENGTPHLQGYIRFSKKKRIGGVKRFVGATAHVEVARNPVAAIQYCKKDGDFTEIGGWESQQGQRNDLQEIIDLVMEGNTEVRWWILNHPDKWSSKSQFIRDCINNLPAPVPVRVYPLRKWQAGLWKWLSFKPDNRHILFVVDRVGNCGKSYFCNYYADCYPDTTQILCPAKGADLAHAYKGTNRVVFFDIPRSRCDAQMLPYGFLESVKNGSIFCSKYDSKSKRFAPAHLVVFMNEMPDLTKLSADRYLVRILNPTDNVVSGPLVRTEFTDQIHSGESLWRDHLRKRTYEDDGLDVEQPLEEHGQDGQVGQNPTLDEGGLVVRFNSEGRGIDEVDVPTVGVAPVAVATGRPCNDEESSDEEGELDAIVEGATKKTRMY